MEKRKEKSKAGNLLTVRGTSERRKAAHDDRSGRRSEIIKRFRGVTQNSHDDAATRSAMDSLQSILLAIKSADQTELLVPLSSLRHYLSCDDPPIQAVIDSGIIDDLIRILFCKNNFLIPDVIWCLSNIATGNHAQTGAVVKALPALLSVLRDCQSLPVNNDVHLTSSLQEDSCWAIGNIAGDSEEYRSALLNFGALQPVVDFSLHCIHAYRASAAIVNTSAADAYLSRANTAVWTISNIARGSSPGDIFIISGVIAPLLDLLRSDSMSMSTSSAELKLQSEICWFFAFLTAKDDATVNTLMTQGLAEAFTCAIRRADPLSISTVPCLRVLVNLCSGLPLWAEHLLRQETLLPSVLLHCNVLTAHKAVVKESLLLLRCLYGVSEELRLFVLQCPSGAPLLQCIAEGLLSDVFDMQREALFSLQSACLQPAILNFFPSLHSTPILRQLVQLLHAHDTEVNMSCMQILRGTSSHPPVVQTLAGLGLHDVLDSIQYGPGDPAMVHAARTLAEDLFEREESEEDNENDGGRSQQGQGGLGGGIRLGGQSQRGSAAAPAGPSGVGRGSHLLRPAWMTPM